MALIVLVEAAMKEGITSMALLSRGVIKINAKIKIQPFTVLHHEI